MKTEHWRTVKTYVTDFYDPSVSIFERRNESIEQELKPYSEVS